MSQTASPSSVSPLAHDLPAGRWHPVAALEDLSGHHVFHAAIEGQELAVWQADDGFLNVWENRCLHLGVRLSIGISDGRELKCQYHGWRYASRTAGCTYIPAHPANAPARTIANRTFPSAARYGLVWSSLGAGGAVPAVPALERATPFVLRAVAVAAPADIAMRHLRSYRFRPSDIAARAGGDGAPAVTAEAGDAFSLTLRAHEEGAETRAVFFVQPVDAGRSVIRGILDGVPAEAGRLAVLHHHDERLALIRDAAAAEAARRPAPAVSAPAPAAPVAHGPEAGPEAAAEGPRVQPALRVQVARKWLTAQGIAAFRLVPLAGHLPAVQPGAHIDVHLPNGLVRPYSLVNAPGEGGHYVIAVKREAESRGGSACLHDSVREGDVLAVSAPRNTFVLRRDATDTLLIAGGIGLTPLLAMAQALAGSGLAFTLHAFAQSRAHLAFPERLDDLGARAVVHPGLDAQGTGAALAALLGDYRPGRQVYLCGPAGMLAAARAAAAAGGWPADAVRAEYFANPEAPDTAGAFEVALARSCLTLSVPEGRTVLQVLQQAGVEIPSSCEQGACGACMCDVIDGEPDHRDVCLSAGERAEGRFLPCVSRARSARLVLDI